MTSSPSPSSVSASASSATSCGYRLTFHGLMVVAVGNTMVPPHDQSTPTTTTSTTTSTSPTTTPWIVATSAATENKTQLLLIQSKEHQRPALQNNVSHRKGFLDSFQPKPFVTSAIRVVVQQGSMILAHLYSDQLEQDMKRNQLVQSGKLSLTEADEQSKEWEKMEWEKRWKVFPQKCFHAFTKFHAIILTMRVYEHVADSWLGCSSHQLDKWTADIFLAAKQQQQQLMNTTTTTNNTTNNNNGHYRMHVAKDMFYTTYWANMIASLADYSVHQVLLCYGYYIYYQQQQKQQQAKLQLQSPPSSTSTNTNTNTNTNTTTNDEANSTVTILSFSLLKKSIQLACARWFGLICSAFGGALGTLWWPGWGTVLGSNIGEGMSGILFKDTTTHTTTTTTTCTTSSL